MVSRLGALNWRRLYSVVSIASFLVLVHGCGLARQEPVALYQPPAWTRQAGPRVAGPLTPGVPRRRA